MPVSHRRDSIVSGYAAGTITRTQEGASSDMPEFTLPPLPYPYEALEPTIDTTTMQIHHDKHHQAYVNNLNAALKDHPTFFEKTVEEIVSNLSAVPEAVRTAVQNNAGGHVNHTFFWEIMTPGGSKTPTGALAA